MRSLILFLLLAGVSYGQELQFATGLIPPANLPEQAAEQNRKALPFIRALASARDGRWFGPDPTANKFDWRDYGVCVDAKNQGSCGSCWAFGTIGCVEGAAGALSGRAGLDLSEQEILDRSGAGSCAGGWFDALDYVVSRGVSSEKAYPYVGYVQRRPPSPQPTIKALTWGYVDPRGDQPSVSVMKRALCQFGPLGVAIKADGALSNYRGGVWRSPRGSINHAVTLVGWDDNDNAWIIKNSWGRSWGDDGFFLGAYDSNIGYGACFCVMVPSWVEAADAARLTGCDGCLPDEISSEGLAIDGPDTALPGTLVTLVAPDVPDSRQTWEKVPGAVANTNWVMDTGRSQMYFAAPVEPGRYVFGLAISTQAADPFLLYHVLTVQGQPQPDPEPEPKPEPEPEPDPWPDPEPKPEPEPEPEPDDDTVIDQFGEDVRDWAVALVDPVVRRETAGDLADNFRDVAEQLKAGQLETVGEALAKVRKANTLDLDRDQREAWTPWFDRLTTRWLEAIEEGELQNASTIELAARQVALGLRASASVRAGVRREATAPAAVPLPTRTRLFPWRR